jgi:hypothetical protein
MTPLEPFDSQSDGISSEVTGLVLSMEVEGKEMMLERIVNIVLRKKLMGWWVGRLVVVR